MRPGQAQVARPYDSPAEAPAGWLPASVPSPPKCLPASCPAGALLLHTVMPIQCEECGHIHWEESLSLARYAAWVLKKDRGEAFTSRDLAEGVDISIQNANNTLRRLGSLNVIERLGRDRQASGGVENKWVHYCSDDYRHQILTVLQGTTFSNKPV